MTKQAKEWAYCGALEEQCSEPFPSRTAAIDAAKGRGNIRYIVGVITYRTVSEWLPDYDSFMENLLNRAGEDFCPCEYGDVIEVLDDDDDILNNPASAYNTFVEEWAAKYLRMATRVYTMSNDFCSGCFGAHEGHLKGCKNTGYGKKLTTRRLRMALRGGGEKCNDQN